MTSTDPTSVDRPAEVRAARGVAVGSVLLALGDSIAAGIGAPHVSEGCMAILAARLRARARSMRLLNLAVPGETSTSMLRPGGQLEVAERAIIEAAARGEDIAPVVLSIGGNDVMEAALLGEAEAHRQLRANLDRILGRLDAALRAAHGAGLRGRGALQTVYNPFELGADGHPTADELAPRRSSRGGHNRELRAAAARQGIAVADVAGAFRGRARELTWVRSGDIHPSRQGHAVIADVYMIACGWDL